MSLSQLSSVRMRDLVLRRFKLRDTLSTTRPITNCVCVWNSYYYSVFCHCRYVSKLVLDRHAFLRSRCKRYWDDEPGERDAKLIITAKLCTLNPRSALQSARDTLPRRASCSCSLSNSPNCIGSGLAMCERVLIAFAGPLAMSTTSMRAPKCSRPDEDEGNMWLSNGITTFSLSSLLLLDVVQ